MTDFGNKLEISVKNSPKTRHKKAIKTRHIDVNKKLDDLAKEVRQISIKGYNFFLCRIFFAGDDGSQNAFIYQPRFKNINIKQVNNEHSISAWKSKGITRPCNHHSILWMQIK